MKHNIVRTIFFFATLLLTLAAVALVVLAIPLAAQTNDKTTTCSLATLKGTFGFVGQGTILAQLPGLPAPPVLTAGSGTVTYDGNGNFSVKDTGSINGAISPGTATGTYTVNPDCTYSDVLTTTGGPVFREVGTIIGRGIFQEIHIIDVDPWFINVLTLRKTPEGGCSQESVKGTYTVFGQGFLAPPGMSTLVPVAHVGIFTADGQGTFSGEDTIRIANTTVQDTFTAKYTVNPDCTVTDQIFTAIGEIDEVGTFTGVGRSQEYHGIITNPGWVVAETAKKQ